MKRTVGKYTLQGRRKDIKQAVKVIEERGDDPLTMYAMWEWLTYRGNLMTPMPPNPPYS